jgi:Skp family chaperone for outer membrane proteins
MVCMPKSLAYFVKSMETVMNKMIVLAAFAFALFTMPAFANEHAAIDWSPCKAEIEKNCKDVKGDHEIDACLEKHHAELSTACAELADKHK